MSAIRFFSIALTAVFLFSTSTFAQENQRVVVEVNGIPITNYDIRIRLILNNQYVPNFAATLNPQLNRQQKVAREKMRQQLIEEILFLQFAAKKGIKADNEVRKKVNRRMKFLIKRFGSLSNLKVALEKKQLLVSDLRTTIQNQILIRDMIVKAIGKHFYITPQEMRRFYTKLKKKLAATGKIPEEDFSQVIFSKPQLKIQQIQIWSSEHPSRREALKIAQEVRKKLRKGGDFTALVKKYSNGPKMKKKGIWDELSNEGDLGDALKRAVKKLEIGETSGIITTGFGFAIVRVLDRKKPKIKDFPTVERYLEKAIQNQKYRKYLTRLKDKLRDEAIIVEYDE